MRAPGTDKASAREVRGLFVAVVAVLVLGFCVLVLLRRSGVFADDADAGAWVAGGMILAFVWLFWRALGAEARRLDAERKRLLAWLQLHGYKGERPAAVLTGRRGSDKSFPDDFPAEVPQLAMYPFEGVEKARIPVGGFRRGLRGYLSVFVYMTLPPRDGPASEPPAWSTYTLVTVSKLGPLPAMVIDPRRAVADAILARGWPEVTTPHADFNDAWRVYTRQPEVAARVLTLGALARFMEPDAVGKRVVFAPGFVMLVEPGWASDEWLDQATRLANDLAGSLPPGFEEPQRG